MLYGLQWLERVSKPCNGKVQQKPLRRNWHDFFKSVSSRLIKHADQARLEPLSCRERPSFWEFHTHTFLGLISFCPFLILMAFLGPLISGLVFLVCGFRAPLWALRPEFWFLLRAVRLFCSCSRCSHLYRNPEDKEDELGKDIIINNYIIIKVSWTTDTSAAFNSLMLYIARPLMSACYGYLQGEPYTHVLG